MKTLNDAIEMRNTILKFKKAAICKDIRERQIIDHCGCWWRTNRVEVSGMYEMRKSIFKRNILN
jgi:hypothetical protein